MKNKKCKQELTRLILTALILGGGSLYGPVAEADTAPIVINDNVNKNNASSYGLSVDTVKKSVTENGTKMGVPIIINGVSTGNNGLTEYSFYGESGRSTSATIFANITLNGGTLKNFAGCYDGAVVAVYNKAYIHHNVGTGTVYNNVTVNGDVYGGHSSGNVTNNTVEINQQTGKEVTVTGNVYGGKSTSGSAGMGVGTGNSVTINGGNIGGSIYGGYTEGTGASYNEVTINGGSIGGHIYGGWLNTSSSSSNSVHNTVTISGGTFSDDTLVYGGAGGTAAGENTVNINGGVTLAGIYGGITHGLSTTTNNKLYLGYGGTNGINVTNEIKGFSNVYITNNVSFSNGGKVLTVKAFWVDDSSDLPNVDVVGLLGKNTLGTMTLISTTDTSLNGIKVAYETADDYKVLKTNETSSYTKTVSTGSETGQSVNFAYNNDHTVFLADAKTLKYTIANKVTSMTFSNTAVTWGTTPRTSTTGFTFGSNTGINAQNLTFSSTPYQFSSNPLGSTKASMTLLSNANGISAGTITQPGTNKGIVNASFSSNDMSFTGAAKGTVSAGNNKVTYTLNSGTLNGIDLDGWNGTGDSNILSGWTSGLGNNSVKANFTFQPEDNVTDILTATEGFFNDNQITGSRKYSGGTTLVDTVENGVTFTGYKGGGVKATAGGSKLTLFKEMMDVRNLTFGNMTWGTDTGRVASSGDNFANVGNGDIDATGLTFTNPTAATGSMDLLSGATDLQAGLTIVNPNHSQNFTGSAAANGATFDGTINGTVATTAGKITYTVGSKNITGINLANWNGNTTAIDGWTSNFGTGSIKAEGFTAPTLTAGQSQNIFTTSGTGFFSDTNITGAQKYGASATPSSDTVNGVTFTGNQEKGVKASANGQNLVYAVGNMAVSDITLGNMEVGAGGIVTKRTADANYTFNGSTTINATNLTFDKPADVADSTLVSNATNITSSNPVTRASHSQAITNASMGGGITVSGTLNGTVSAVDGGVDYTVNNKTVSSMDLSGWDTNTEGTTLPTTDDKWTGSNVAVSTGTFTAPTTDKTIFTTNIGGFFGDVTGAMAYKSGAAFSGDVDAGVTLSGTKSGGVKKSDDGKNLNFIAELRTVNNIALGNMDWGTGRAITGNYDFSTVANNGVDASGLKFTFTGDTVNTISSSTPVWNLVTDATGLNGGLIVNGSPVSQTVSYGINNVANLSGTLTGNVNTANNTVQYNVTGKTLDKVDISNWDGSTTDTALNTSWSKKDSGISVIGSGFTAPTTVGDYNILTATSTGFFTGANIDSSIAYQTSGAYSETANNITLSGTQAKGIKANDTGTALQYSFGKADIKTIKLGAVNYTKGGTWLDKSDGSTYTFSNLNSLDTTGFSMSMTDDQKKDARATDAFNMTLVKGTSDLPDIAAKDAGSSNYTYAATNGLTVGGTVSGSVSASGHDVLYKVTGNKATTLNITNVTWDEGNAYYNRDNSELDYKDAVVDSSNIFFSGITSLNKDKIMTLISNYGSGINKTRSGIFTIDDGNGNLLKGKGVAYYDSGSNSLMYKVTLGAGEVQPAVSATNNKAILIIPDGQEHQGTVTGGEAKGDGDSTDNEQGVKGKIITNTDGTGGDVNGGTSEEGDSRRNKADVEDSTIEGDVNGGKSENGNSTDNEAEVDHSNVGGDVNGGKTDGDGETKGNEANVKNGSKVTGSVTGGRSGGNGDCTGNAAEVEGSEVGGDVNGGQSDGDGNTRENKTHVKDSKVTGNVIGGHSGQNDGSGGNGESTGNMAEVEGSEVGGNVNGGRSEQGNANKNESTVSGGSKVTGDVTGGSSGGGGTANENKTTVEGGSHIGGNVTGGESNGGNTNKNETTVSGSTVDKDVIGGKTSGNGTSNENKTNVNGSKVGGNVIGGQSENGNAEKNETTISGGSTIGGDVIGGKTTGTGNANENKVTLDGGSTVNGNIYGGYSQNGDASGNDVNIGTGKINGDIYGGFGSGNTTNNTITLSSGADVSNSNIFGGSNGSAGNTLNIGTSTEAWSGGGQSVKNISNFETLNFSSVPWNNSNAALNISDGSASDLSMTTIQAPQVAFSGVKRLSSGSTMMFLNQSNVNPATKRATNLVAGSAFTLGTAMEGSGRLTLDAAGNVVYLIENASVSEQTHNTVMAAEAAVLSINSGNDFINSATEGLAQKENVGTDGLATYAKIGGQSMKQDTGSHVKVNTWNAILALGHKNTKKQSAFEYGAFVEHGWGNFATHNNGLRGDGSAEYTGGGLLAKWKTNNGTYVEGSFRAGTVNEKANNLLRDAVQAYGYDERTSYAGFHIGVGKETVLKNGNLVDVYGRYFYNRKNGMNFNAGFDEYNIDAVTSQILRVGARYTVKSGSRWNYYGDLSYEHEFDGKATGRVNDMAIRGADISGGSLRMELGASLTPNDESPWEVDFNLTAYAGNKSGFTGGVSVKYAF